MNRFIYIIFTILLIQGALKAQQNCVIYGRVLEESGGRNGIYAVSVQVLNSNYATTSDKQGYFRLTIPFKKHVSLLFSHVAYQNRVKELDPVSDSLHCIVVMKEKAVDLEGISVSARSKPDTLVGSPQYSIYDFDFYEDKFILLTAERNLDKAELKLADRSRKILYSVKLPADAGIAKELYRDYMGFVNVICEQAIYRINVYNDAFVLFSLNPEDYNAFVKPIVDTIHGKLIFSDYWKDYPMFNYYSYSEKDSARRQLITITNADLLEAYNFEYYSLKPREKLEARRMAMDLKTDKRIVAALMSGFTKSLFYEPLYAPLFIVKDTMCVFDHYKDMLFHFDKQGNKIDSTVISYNHPKNWKEWKRVMVKDDVENTIYAVYDRNGHKYLRLIDYRTGKNKGLYNLQFHSADKIKIRDGYAYYIYRPFESTQQKFLYRELIRLESD
ncbi:MAG: carboxypeptidase-like regulatory domain-containing protein [Bacteroidetes bacterium]|nr:carboxypeptidase-like regulatory domain-containing protein [Bacteroidota bacterium]